MVDACHGDVWSLLAAAVWKVCDVDDEYHERCSKVGECLLVSAYRGKVQTTRRQHLLRCITTISTMGLVSHH